MSIFTGPIFTGTGGIVDPDILLSDTFSGANGVNLHNRSPVIGPLWQALTGQWILNNNRATQEDVISTDGQMLVADVGEANVYIEVLVTTPSSGQCVVGVIVRCLNFNTYNDVELYSIDPAFAAYEYPTGGPSVAIPWVDATGWANNTTYLYKIWCWNNYLTIIINVDGVDTYFMSSSKFTHQQTATKHGIFTSRDPEKPNAAFWDNITIRRQTEKPPLYNLIYDPFTAADGTPINGRGAPQRIRAAGSALWTGGTFSIVSNQAVCQSATAIATLESEHSDFDISSNLRCGAANGNFGPSLLIRYVDDNNTLQAMLGGDGKVYIFKIEAGTPLILGQSPWSVDTNLHNLRITAIGDQLTAYTDGVQQFQVTSSFNLTATRVGIKGFVLGAAKDAFNDFSVKPV